MKAGQLDRRVTLQQKTVTQDPDYGTETIVWATFASRIAAQVQDTLPSKSESVQQGVRVGTRPARVRLRYLAGITSDMRVVLHDTTDRILEIIGGPAEIGRREGIELVCQEYTL
jgi:head-tail adaptor